MIDLTAKENEKEVRNHTTTTHIISAAHTPC